MDDPGWSWPAWKFGMKRDDLFTKLHDKYNAVTFSIQDPEAFHHDVYEISNAASTAAEFHRLLADRRELRICELNESLESASLEIIANPKLIGTKQWEYALQLFRTKSLDSLVRYFASYLPADHRWHHSQDSTAYSGEDPIPVKPFFDDDEEEKPIMTHEPVSISTTSIPASHLPPSPRSMTMCSDSSAASPVDVDHHNYILNNLTPARTLSFSEPESDIIHSGTDCDEDETSQSDDLDTPSTSTSVSDISEPDTFSDYHSKGVVFDDEGIPLTQSDDMEDDLADEESETPTPRNELPTDSYITHTTTQQSTKISSTTRTANGASSPLYTHVLQEYARSSRKIRHDGSPGLSRRSPELGRIQKASSPDGSRIRPGRGRRRLEV